MTDIENKELYGNIDLFAVMEENIIQMISTIETKVSDNNFSYPLLFNIDEALKEIIQLIEYNEVNHE